MLWVWLRWILMVWPFLLDFLWSFAHWYFKRLDEYLNSVCIIPDSLLSRHSLHEKFHQIRFFSVCFSSRALPHKSLICHLVLPQQYSISSSATTLTLMFISWKNIDQTYIFFPYSHLKLRNTCTRDPSMEPWGTPQVMFFIFGNDWSHTLNTFY